MYAYNLKNQYLQGIPQSRIEEWMQALPCNKIPKLNSPGEAYREAQLLQQLPKQDLSLRQCHHISQKDQSSYQVVMDSNIRKLTQSNIFFSKT